MQDDEQELHETTDQPEPEPVEEPIAEPEVAVSEEPPAGPEGEAVQLPTVVVLVERDGESGQINVDVVAQGDVRATEIETVLKMGLNKWRQKINLPG